MSEYSKLEDLQNFLFQKFDFRYNVFMLAARVLGNPLWINWAIGGCWEWWLCARNLGNILVKPGAKRIHTRMGEVYGVKTVKTGNWAMSSPKLAENQILKSP